MEKGLFMLKKQGAVEFGGEQLILHLPTVPHQQAEVFAAAASQARTVKAQSQC